MRFDRRLARILAVDACRLVAVAVVLELVVRTAAPIYCRQLFDDEYTGSFPMDRNEDDYRGPRVPEAKASGEYRILTLGDSVTFGTGVSSGATYSAQLAKMAARHADGPVSVVNGGVEGVSIEDIVYWWDRKWSAYQPDLVVLAVTGYMVSLEVVRPGKIVRPEDHLAALHQPLTGVGKATRQANRLVHRLALPSFTSIEVQRLLYWDGLLNHNVNPKAPYSVLLALGWQQGDLDPTLEETAWERLASEVAQLGLRVNGSGARLVVTYVGPRFLLSDDMWDNDKNVPIERLSIDPMACVADLCDRLGVTYVDARAALVAGREEIQRTEHRRAPMYIHFDYTHLSEDGHRALAKAIAEAVR